VVFSGRQDCATTTAMLQAGADQYVLKTGRVRPLLQALETAYRHLFEQPAAGEAVNAADTGRH
jgi:DNA-binding NarL/FixJ family response regulator